MHDIERRLERMVEGGFARVFRSGLKPVEVGRRLVREMDAGRSIGVNGSTVAPNEFRCFLSADDHASFVEMIETVRRELAEVAREHARQEKYAFLGPITVDIGVDGRLRRGNFRLDAGYHEGPGGRTPGALILPDGRRMVLGEAVVTIGRLAECTIAIDDPNVSRAHAEIRPQGTGFHIVDLASTNGTLVNGQRATDRPLADGDRIEIGAAMIRFEGS